MNEELKRIIEKPQLFYEGFKLRIDLEILENWEELHKFIPELPEIRPGYTLKLLPPGRGAVLRFFIRKVDSEKYVSVFLDMFDRLGFMQEPYWEIYPYKDEITKRFLLNEMENLFDAIYEELDRGN